MVHMLMPMDKFQVKVYHSGNTYSGYYYDSSCCAFGSDRYHVEASINSWLKQMFV